MLRIVAPGCECIRSVNNSHLDAATSWMKVISWTDSAVHGNDFELIPTIRMERGHSVEGSFSREFSHIYIIRELSPSEVGSRSRRYQKSAFWEINDPFRDDFENFVPKGFTVSQIHVLCANFVKFGRPEIGKVVRYLPDKKKTKKNRLALPLSLLRGSRPKYVRARTRQYTRSAPNFIQNPFTFGGVIAERVNVVQMRHKVFPILGEASASSPSNKLNT